MAKPPKPPRNNFHETKLVPKDHPRTDFGGWSPDHMPDGGDWIKTLSWQLPTDPDDFLKHLGAWGKPAADQRGDVMEYMRLPGAKRMPRSLVRALYYRGLLSVQPPKGATEGKDKGEDT